MARIDQPVLPLAPAEAAPIGSVAALVEGPEGGVVFVSGLVTFTFAAGDDWGRRIAAAQQASTEFATVKDVAEAFGVRADTVSRWKRALAVDGIAGLKPGRPGPEGAEQADRRRGRPYPRPGPRRPDAGGDRRSGGGGHRDGAGGAGTP